MKIALDVMGGDFGVNPNVEGAVLAVKKLGCEVFLVGKEDLITNHLKSLNLTKKIKDKLTIINASEVITMEDDPAVACKKKVNSSLVLCANLVRRKQCDGFVSAGNSGATMVSALLRMGRIRGVMRPAIATPLPSEKGLILLLDAGANVECKAEYLSQFAIMGHFYSKFVFGVDSPSVGLLSVGEEENKGNYLTKEANKLIKTLDINYRGNIEGRDITSGNVDIVICDGFVGNVTLKLAEGLSRSLFRMIKREVLKRPLSKIGALLMRPVFNTIKAVTDPDVYGGAPLLGINGVVIVCHGKSNDVAICNGITASCNMVKTNVIEKIKNGIKKRN